METFEINATSDNEPSPRVNSEESEESTTDVQTVVQTDTEADSSSLLLLLTVGVFSGFIFGFMLEKSKVYEPYNIRAQMRFSSFLMLKAFLAATAVGTCILSTLALFGISERKGLKPFHSFFGVPMLGTFVGGCLTGLGMTLSGACPGTVFAQLGAGTTNAWLVLLGGLSGALAFAYSIDSVKRRWPTALVKAKNSLTVDRWLKKPQEQGARWPELPFFVTAWAFACMLAGTVLVVEHLWDWQKDLTDEQRVAYVKAGESMTLDSPVWHPALSGVVMGSVQLLLFGLLERCAGCSSSFVTIVATFAGLVHKRMKDVAPYMTTYTKRSSYWQVAFVVGIVLGAFVSHDLADPNPSAPVAGHWLLPLAGGFLNVFGARMAGGCTSGHGISGMAQLNLPSFIAVMGMFAGGIGLELLVDL